MRIATRGSGTVHRAPIPTGPTVEVLVGQDAGGALAVAELTLPPGARMPEHAHGTSTALLVLLSGELALSSGDQRATVSPGSVVLVEPDEWIGLVNETDRPVSLVAAFAPPDFVQTFDAWPLQSAASGADAEVSGGEVSGREVSGGEVSGGEGETLVAALEREHRLIDAGIEAFAESLARSENRIEPLQRAMSLLRRHIYVEEEFLFPPLRTAGLMAPIMVMLREHGELWHTMEGLDALVGDRAAADTAAVLERCREFLAQLERHNSKEEPIVYPQVGQTLTEDAGAELNAFLAAGEMPEGWVCQGVAAR